jgi:iron complex outermembrane receptor protein
MKKRMLFLLLLPLFASAQIKIKGRISTNNQQEQVIGANVYFHELKKGAITGLDGSYEIANLPKGLFIIQVKYIGFEHIVKPINLTKDTVIDFNLNESIFEMHEIVTTGIGRSTELKLSPVSIKSIDKNYLNVHPATNLVDALKAIPGISQITTGVAISKPVIRGLGYNRILTLVDGIRQEGQQWGDEHGIEVDEFGVDRVEIVKGPGSLVYGSDGLAGVINFISPSVMPEGKSELNFASNYQSNNQLMANSIMSSGTKKSINWNIRATDKSAEDYKNAADGKVYNSGFNEQDVSAMLGINKSWGYSQISFSSFNQQLALVEGDRDSTGAFVTSTLNQINTPYQKIGHQKISSSTLWVLGNAKLNIDLALQNNKRREFANPDLPDNAALFFNLTTFNYTAKVSFQTLNKWQYSTGLNGMLQNNSNLGEEFLIPAYQQNDIGLFLTSEKFIKPNLLFSYGARIDHRDLVTDRLVLDEFGMPIAIDTGMYFVKFNPLSKQTINFSAAAGLSYQYSNKSNFKINLSRGFRAAAVSELASNGIHEGSFRYELGNENLKSEFNHQLDLVYNYTSEHLNIELSPFANFINNYIFVQKLTSAAGTDSIINSEDPAPVFKFAQSNALLYGSEIFIDFHPHPIDWLHIENSFSFVNAIKMNGTDSTRYLPFVPPAHYRVDVRAQTKSIGKNIKNAFVKFSVDHYFAQNKVYTAYGTEQATPAYTLIGAGMGADLILSKQQTSPIKLLLNVENLGDVIYQSHLSRLKYAPINPLSGRQGVFNMGRNFSIKLIYTI